MSKAEKLYEKNILNAKVELSILEKKSIFCAILRLAIVIITIFFMYYFYKQDNLQQLIAVGLVGLLIFMVIAYYHNNILNNKKRAKIILEYNNRGINRLNGKWKENDDIGEEFIDLNHNFTSDLDIFGKNSIFAWVNTTNTTYGRNALGKLLKLKTLPKVYEIKDNQEAMKELKDLRDFTQEMFIKSYTDKSDKVKKNNINDIIKWLKTESGINNTIKYIPYFFIAITTLALFLVITKKIPVSYMLFIFTINYLVVKLLTRNLDSVIELFINNKQEIIKCSGILELIQKQEFKSNRLKEITKKLHSETINCTTEMKKLKSLINWLGDSKGNAYYLIINVTILSDIFILYNLEKWKLKNGKNLESWLDIMGEIEALVSLSNLAFEQEEWNFAKVSSKDEIMAKGIYHPIIGKEAIANDFSFDNNKKVALITGSNMSGKSTFLRTIGLNMVLTYLGLPCSSEEFNCGIYQIYTCMRTQDNLEESISSFYAEILRIKMLIEAGRRGEKVFFLLDEIFKGTNSVDRHDGAKILIEQLVDTGAMGLVSTHDLELCTLQDIKSWLINYSFREYYEKGKIKFDYKLRNGKSMTQNAKYLMKLAGIHIE